jgi:cell division protein FtsB
LDPFEEFRNRTPDTLLCRGGHTKGRQEAFEGWLGEAILRTRRKKQGLSLRRKLFLSGAAFLFLVFLIASFFGERGLVEVYQTQKKKNTLVQAKIRLLAEKRKLEREIEELKTNPEAVEKKAREKLWLMKPDEIVIIIR